MFCRHSSPSPNGFNEELSAFCKVGEEKHTIQAEIGTLGKNQVCVVCRAISPARHGGRDRCWESYGHMKECRLK